MIFDLKQWTYPCEQQNLPSFYRAMLRRVWYCYGKSSVCQSV